jgi:hypothetical protein
MDEFEMKSKVLQDLINEMKNSDGMRLKPKAVEVSVSSVKPGLELDKESHEGDEGQEDLHPDDKESLMSGDHQEPDGDELSPEDMSMLEHLLGGSEEEEENC